jgi:hypothetical protein
MNELARHAAGHQLPSARIFHARTAMLRNDAIDALFRSGTNFQNRS